LFVLFTKSVNFNSFAVRIATSITLLAIFSLIGSLFQKLLTLIPIIKSNPDYNYAINFSLQLVFLSGIIALAVYLENRRKNKSLY